MAKSVANEEATGGVVKTLIVDDAGKSFASPDVLVWNKQPGAGGVVFYYEALFSAESPFISWQQRASVDINRETDEIAVLIAQYEDGYTAYPPDIDGVVSQGGSVSEALDNVKDAISLHLEEFGTEVLPPKADRAIKVFLDKIRLPKTED